MTDRELDVKCAEFRGWTAISVSPYNGETTGLPPGMSALKPGSTADHRIVPRYASNLSLSCELEDEIERRGLGDAYSFRLMEIIAPDRQELDLGRDEWLWEARRATARQICEAFVKVMEQAK